MLAILLILAFAYLAALSLAEHVTCSWSPPGTPDKWGMKKFCTAQHTGVQQRNGDVWNVFKCSHLFEGYDVYPATWDVIADLTINFATPCGNGGWFKEEHDWCPASHFALTVGNVSYGIGKHDDCR